jgi:hypothetical protein
MRPLPHSFIEVGIARSTEDLVMTGHQKRSVWHDFELMMVRMIVMKVKDTAGEVQPNPR